MINRNMKITNTCPFCGNRHVVWVDNVDYASWVGGSLAQNAFPYLNSTERSLICAHSARQTSLGRKTKIFGDDIDECIAESLAFTGQWW